MTQETIPDFTDTELWTIGQTLRERYGRDIETQIGDAEIRLYPEDRTLTSVPAVVWSERGANFVVFKTGRGRYRAQFFYRGFQQYGTGREEYDDLALCVTTLLQVQSDHIRREQLEPVDPGPRAKN
jgi:hypothetical protein